MLIWNPHFPYLKLTRTFALAQHHGIPTRLLDWTRNPRVAAFFAADSEFKQEGGSLCVWAVKLGATTSHLRLKEMECPKVDFEFLHRQEGLFLYPLYADSYYLEYGNWPEVDQLLHKTREFRETVKLDSGVLVKITLPLKEKDEVLNRLSSIGIARYTLMPTFDNIAEHVLNRSRWHL